MYYYAYNMNIRILHVVQAPWALNEIILLKVTGAKSLQPSFTTSVYVYVNVHDEQVRGKMYNIALQDNIVKQV